MVPYRCSGDFKAEGRSCGVVSDLEGCAAFDGSCFCSGPDRTTLLDSAIESVTPEVPWAGGTAAAVGVKAKDPKAGTEGA